MISHKAWNISGTAAIAWALASQSVTDLPSCKISQVSPSLIEIQGPGVMRGLSSCQYDREPRIARQFHSRVWHIHLLGIRFPKGYVPANLLAAYGSGSPYQYILESAPGKESA